MEFYMYIVANIFLSLWLVFLLYVFVKGGHMFKAIYLDIHGQGALANILFTFFFSHTFS